MCGLLLVVVVFTQGECGDIVAESHHDSEANCPCGVASNPSTELGRSGA